MGKKRAAAVQWEEAPDARENELKDLLFGAAKQDPGRLFDIDEEAVEAAAAAEVARQKRAKRGAAGGAGGGAVEEDEGPLFYEDTAPAEEASSSDDDDDEDDEERKGGEGAAAGSSSDEKADASGDDSDDSDGSEGSDGEEGEGAAAAARRAAGAAAGGRRQAVWADPDDASVRVDVSKAARLRKLRKDERTTVVGGSEYETALRRQHAALNPRTGWADTKRKVQKRSSGFGADSESDQGGEGEDEEGAEALVSRAGGLLGSSRRGGAGRLPPGTLEVSRLKDANQHDPHAAVVQSVEFHPQGQLMLTAGLDKRIRLFQVDGVRNPRVQSIFLDDMPVHKAAFACGGTHIIAVGRRPHFYMCDLAAGKVERVTGPSGAVNTMKSLESFAVSGENSGAGGPMAAFLGDQGYVPLVSLRSRQWVGNLKMSGSVRSASFSPDGNQLLTAGGDGLVHTWDLRTRRCIGQMVDHGNKDSASLALSRDGRHLATGSASGMVNVYRRNAATAGLPGRGGLLRPSAPVPLKEIGNLTTAVDTLAFSPDGQVLALASRMKKDAMRLVHVPTLTVFSNWPTARSPLHYVHSLAFSPNGGFLAVGNARGRVLLYRLHHYVDI
ncbi:hypothetical protein FOA52_012738 [Chlamydomonas sp. UWO 241]|nr:hypothetical protein FOA52_012738 [Chlamydomonas sp. UWO 241]